jgi:hypothetical protein
MARLAYHEETIDKLWSFLFTVLALISCALFRSLIWKFQERLVTVVRVAVEIGSAPVLYRLSTHALIMYSKQHQYPSARPSSPITPIFFGN